MTMRHTILLIFYFSAPINGFSQIAEEIWQNYCEDGFKVMTDWKTKEETLEEYARVTLAKAYGALNHTGLTEAVSHRRSIDSMFMFYYGAMTSLMESNDCFKRRWEELEKQLDKEIIKKAQDTTTITIKTVPPPPIRELPCAITFFKTDIKPDKVVVFEITIRDCKSADTDRRGYAEGTIYPKESFEVIYLWLTSWWKDLEIGDVEKMPHYFEVEIHGHADALDVQGNLRYGFSLDLPDTVDYRFIENPASGVDKRLGFTIRDVIPYSIHSNEYLALSRAWMPWLALDAITNKEPLLVAEVHNQVGGKYRGVDIKISYPILFKELVKKHTELLQNKEPFSRD